MRLFLVRHAQSVSTTLPEDALVPDDDANPLTANGQAEAQELAEYFKNTCRISVLYSSPSRRARETAQPTARALGTEAVIDNRLDERRFAYPPGTRVADCRRIQEEHYVDVDALLPGGESVAQHRQRIAAWISELRTRPDQLEDIIVISHGDTIEHLQACLTGSSLAMMARMFTSLHTGHCHLWSQIQGHDGRAVWRLDGIDLAPGSYRD